MSSENPSPASPDPAGNPYAGQTPLSPSDEKMWATLIHIAGIPFFFVPALVGFLLLKDRGPFIREHSLTALNFQLTLLLTYFVGSILTVIAVGYLITAAAWIVSVIFSIIAALAANQGQRYTYPLSIKFIR